MTFQDELFAYMRQNPGKRMTMDELKEKFPDHGESTYAGACRTLVDRYPDLVFKVKRGVYVYGAAKQVKHVPTPESQPQPEVDLSPESMKVMVLKSSTDGKTLLVMGEDKELYRMTKDFTL